MSARFAALSRSGKMRKSSDKWDDEDESYFDVTTMRFIIGWVAIVVIVGLTVRWFLS